MVLIGTGAAATTSRITWRAPDGTLSFSYPRGWTLANPNGGNDTRRLPLYLINGKPEPRDLADGDLRIDFDSEPSKGRTVADLRAEDCRSQGAEIVVTSCQTVQINGWQWSWVAASEPYGPPPGADRFLATSFKGRVFRASGFVPSGSQAAETVQAMRAVLLSLRVGSQLPGTGSKAISIFALGLALTLIGVQLRITRPKSDR